MGVAFMAMMGQIPLVFLTAPFEKWQGPWSVVGNCTFWGALCLVGQPSAVLYYFYRWNFMYGVGK
jgi:diacylglycerol O-acyltransferase-1